jgi:hypothetical protein
MAELAAICQIGNTILALSNLIRLISDFLKDSTFAENIWRWLSRGRGPLGELSLPGRIATGVEAVFEIVPTFWAF